VEIHKNPVSTWLSICLAVFTLLLLNCSCGYRATPSIRKLPENVQSLGIPIFKNLTQQFRIEQMITSAVLKEFSVRTRAAVKPNSSGVDVVLLGEINSIGSSPIAFDTEDSFGTAFLVTVQISAKLVRLKDSSIIWENPNYLFRERYVLNSEVSNFFSEENPALERLAKEFAGALTSTILNGLKP
jgi:signal-transduction protein with cAMP-binding, CBS, and nucleotidyltransferase domain